MFLSQVCGNWLYGSHRKCIHGQKLSPKPLLGGKEPKVRETPHPWTNRPERSCRESSKDRNCVGSPFPPKSFLTNGVVRLHTNFYSGQPPKIQMLSMCQTQILQETSGGLPRPYLTADSFTGLRCTPTHCPPCPKLVVCAHRPGRTFFLETQRRHKQK